MFQKLEKNIYIYTLFVSLLISTVNNYINAEFLQFLALFVFVAAYVVKKSIQFKRIKKKIVFIKPDELYDYFAGVIFITLVYGLYADFIR